MSINSRLSFIGVFTATSLMVIVLSVMNGLQRQIKQSILKFEPHLSISNPLGDGKILQWRKRIQDIKNLLPSNIHSIGGMIQSPAIIRINNQIDYTFLRGEEFNLNENSKWELPDYFPPLTLPKGGKTLPLGNYCLIGKEMAFNMDVYLGDLIEIIVPRGQFSLKAGVRPNIKTFRIAGLFQTGHYEYDSKMVILSLRTAQSLFKIGDQVQEINIKLKDIDQAGQIRKDIYKILPFSYQVFTVEDKQKSFFTALAIEKAVLTIIISLIILASVIGIFVSTYQVIRSKRKDIGILKAIGVSEIQILNVFAFSGFFLGVLGTFLGILFGIFVTMNLQNIITGIEYLINKIGGLIYFFITNESWYDVHLMPKNIYYFENIPFYFDIPTLHAVAIISLMLSGIAAYIPAKYASRLEPVDIIRNA